MTDVDVSFDDDLAHLVELNLSTDGRDGLRSVDAIALQTLRDTQRSTDSVSRLATAVDVLKEELKKSTTKKNGQPAPTPKPPAPPPKPYPAPVTPIIHVGRRHGMWVYWFLLLLGVLIGVSTSWLLLDRLNRDSSYKTVVVLETQ